MKTITIVRHAKSSWDNPDVNDFERPLNARGFADAPIIADRISKLMKLPDLFMSSPALRAKTTAEIFVEKFGVPVSKIVLDKDIYDKGSKYIMEFIKNLDEKIESVIIFGHNPDITSLATYYSGNYFDNIPTCGVICIDFDSNNWQDTFTNNGKIRFYEYPKKSIYN